MQSILIGAFIICVVGIVFSEVVLLVSLMRGRNAQITPRKAGLWMMCFLAGSMLVYMLLTMTAAN